MTRVANNDQSYGLTNKNGSVIFTPSNPLVTKINGIGEVDPYNATVNPLYPLGTIGFKGARKFVYAKAGGTILGNSRLLVDANYIPSANGHEDTNGFEGNVYVAAAAGATTVDISDTTARAQNYYEGGYLVLYEDSGVKSCTIRINGSEVGTTAYVRCYLDDPIPWAITASTFCDAYLSPYSNITQPASSHYESFMGVAHNAVTSGYYFWLQTDGPAWLAQYGATTLPGYTADYRDAFAWFDGTIKVGATAGALQRIGYGLGKSVSGYGDSFVMMQLT
jgi:hypothetical protein